MTRASQPSTGHGWQARLDGGKVVLSLSGNWTTHESMSGFDAAAALLLQPKVEAVGFDVSDLGDWDTSLLVFLLTLRSASRRRQVRFDQTGLPAAARQLLAQLSDEPTTDDGGARRVGIIERAGVWTLRRWDAAIAIIRLVGDAILRTAAVLGGKAQTRLSDLLDVMEDAGAAALPLVAVVNILVGAIVAFLGALQLRRLGAETDIANLVGVAEVREMAPLMTAIVMSGRTGGAYAAEIATMQGNEEIDALRATGISVMDYLILPRLSALTTMVPLLGVYAAAVGIFGGFLVALDSTDIVWRAGQHRLQTSPTGRWGERLSLGITQALATDLMARLPQDRVVWSDREQKSARELLVDVEGFDSWPDGHCVLSATWTLTDATNGAVLGGARETFTAAPAGGKTESDVRVVAGMADALGKLADSIASAAAAHHLTRRGAPDTNP